MPIVRLACRENQEPAGLTDPTLSHLALDDLLRVLLGRVTAVIGVDHVGIYLLQAAVGLA
jgi:hypothetical protein